jgi:hypothetical protein
MLRGSEGRALFASLRRMLARRDTTHTRGPVALVLPRIPA